MGRLLTVAVTLVLVAGSIPAMGDPIGDGTSKDPSTSTQAGPSLETTTIVRDSYGVPHVYADSQEALWYANGYVQAQDRLWAMDVLRHLGHGELSQLLGADFLDEDMSNREALYSEERMRAMYEQAPERFRSALEAFADGVNRAAAEMQASGEMPAEYPALQRTFDPWEALDSVAISVYILGRFGAFGGGELSNADLVTTVQERLGTDDGWAAFEDVVWAEHGSTYTTNHEPTSFRSLNQAALADPDAVPEAQWEATQAAANATSFPPNPQHRLTATDTTADLDHPAGSADARSLLSSGSLDIYKGSNALAIGPEHTASGKAVLAGGPQLGYFTPPILYEAGLHGPELSAEGTNVMGTPGLSTAGHTDTLAWTTTSGNSDAIDVVALPAEGERSYRWTAEDGTQHVRELDCRTEEHVVSTPPALYAENTDQAVVDVVEQEVCRADLSPVGAEPERLHRVPAASYEGGEPAWFFAKHDPTRGLEIADGAARMDAIRADSTEAFRDALDDHASNFFQLVVGLDADGQEAICSFHIGHIPVREASLDARLPTPAGDAWMPSDTLTGTQVPDECNPEEDYLANWNNAPADGWPSGDQREEWGEVHRAERLDSSFRAVASTEDAMDVDDVRTVMEKATAHHTLAQEVVPVLLANDPGTATGVTEALEAWQRADYTWAATDGVYDHEAMTVIEQLTEELLDLLFADALGPHAHSPNWDPGERHAVDHGKGANSFSMLVEALTGTARVDWCGAVEGASTCEDVLAIALANTGLDQHDTAEQIPATDQRFSRSMSLGLGPSYEIPMMNRATYDLIHVGSGPRGFATLPPGASGHLNPVDALLLVGLGEEPAHMGDQVQPHIDLDHKPVPIAGPSHWEADGEARTLLVPR